MYDAHFRNLDPQIGKFWQIDPKLEGAEGWSPYAAMLDNPIRYADPLGDSSINPQTKAGFVNLGSTGFNSNNKQYQNLSNQAAKINKQQSEKGEPVVSFTGAITKGTFGGKIKLADFGVSGLASVKETDVVGLRENKLSADGTNSEGKSSERSGYGLNIAGFGVEKMQEMKDNTLTTKNSMPGISTASTTTLIGNNEVYSGTQNNLFSFKAGAYYGVEANISINLTNGVHVAPFPAGSNPSESTQIRIFVPELP